MRPAYPGTTASQTVGPYFALGLSWNGGHVMAGKSVRGNRIRIAGRVLDGDGRPVPDGLLELWQADASGRYRHPEDRGNGRPSRSFSGFGRCALNPRGEFQFLTIKPGRVAAPDGSLQAPHLSLQFFCRGLLRHLCTRLYFGDEETANQEDPVLALVPPDRRDTLIAARSRAARPGYRWNLVLQGPGETVFFEY